LETKSDRNKAYFTEFTEENLSLSLLDLKEKITTIKWHYQGYLTQALPPIFEEQMQSSLFSRYHRGDESDIIREDFTTSISCDLRTQDWLPKLEKHLQVKGTFVAVGLGHISMILEWA